MVDYDQLLTLTLELTKETSIKNGSPQSFYGATVDYISQSTLLETTFASKSLRDDTPTSTPRTPSTLFMFGGFTLETAKILMYAKTRKR